MKRHQVILVNGTDTLCQCFPLGSLDISANITTHHPDDVRSILVAFGKELTVSLRIFHRHQTFGNRRSPNGNHTDIDAVLLGCLDDVVHVIPIAVHAFLIYLLEVEPIRQGRLTVAVHGRNTVHGLHLHHVVARLTTMTQIIGSLITVQTFRQQPSRLTQPKERSPVLMLEITVFFRYLKFAILPRQIYLILLRLQATHRK